MGRYKKGGQSKYPNCEPKSPEYRKAAYINHIYRLSVEELEKLKEEQAGICTICGRNEDEVGKLHIDHCHTSKKIRGLLCFHCNAGLGHFRDNVDQLKEAIKYLENN